MTSWNPIETYPVDKDGWGREVLVLMPATKAHIIIQGQSSPEIEVMPARYVAHVEAGEWLTRAGDDVIAWTALWGKPTHWREIEA